MYFCDDNKNVKIKTYEIAFNKPERTMIVGKESVTVQQAIRKELHYQAITGIPIIRSNINNYNHRKQ
jgi:hypothetical protein